MKNLHKIVYTLIALFTVAISGLGGNTEKEPYDAANFGGVTITPNSAVSTGNSFSAVLDDSGLTFFVEEDCSVSVLSSAGAYIEGYESVSSLVDTQRALYPQGTLWRAVQNYNDEVAHCN